MSAKGTRLNRRGLETRANLLRVAVHVLAEGGPEAVSANLVAREAGVTWGTVQHQFGDTDGLWAAVLTSISERSGPLLPVPHDVPTIAARVEIIVETMWNAFDRPALKAIHNLRREWFPEDGSRAAGVGRRVGARLPQRLPRRRPRPGPPAPGPAAAAGRCPRSARRAEPRPVHRRRRGSARPRRRAHGLPQLRPRGRRLRLLRLLHAGASHRAVLGPGRGCRVRLDHGGQPAEGGEHRRRAHRVPAGPRAVLRTLLRLRAGRASSTRARTASRCSASTPRSSVRRPAPNGSWTTCARHRP
jgi:AcrR family transcriptional regulator